MANKEITEWQQAMQKWEKAMEEWKQARQKASHQYFMGVVILIWLPLYI